MKKILTVSIAIVVAIVAMAAGTKLWVHSHSGNHWSIDVEDLDSISFAEPGILELSFYEKTLSNSGGRFTLGITANRPWTASVNDPGLILGATYGEGNAQLAVTALPNADEDNSYTAIITITLSNGVYKQAVVTVGSKHIKIESIGFKNSLYELYEHEDINLFKMLVITPEGIKDTCKVKWSVSDEDVAEMSGRFLVPKGAGTVKVTATVQNMSATCNISILPMPVESIFLEDMTVPLNRSVMIKCTTEPSVSIKRISFTSSDNEIATIGSDGMVEGKKEGDATITATVDGKEATCKITVKKIDVASVTVTPETARMYKIGETLRLAATVEPKDASFPEISWSSEPAGYVSVENGIVTVMKYYDIDKSVVVTAKADNQTDICNVMVWPQQSTSITLSSTSHTFTEVGKTFTLSIKDIQPTQRTLTDNFKWTTSNKTIAVINNTETVEGNITSVTVKCLAIGTATITCEDTWSKVTTTCTVYADDGTVTDICGNKYKYVKIGRQIWMAENMRCNKYDTESERKGETIRELTSDMSYNAYYFDDSKVTKEYGYLYNWAAVVGLTDEEATKTSHYPFENSRQGICPNGWHVPTAAEWDVLAGYIGSEGGKKLKSSSGWLNDDNGTDAYSFTALPAGSHAYGTEVQYVGEYAKFWTASQNSVNHDYINMRYVSSGYDGIGTSLNIERAVAISLRCVRN